VTQRDRSAIEELAARAKRAREQLARIRSRARHKPIPLGALMVLWLATSRELVRCSRCGSGPVPYASAMLSGWRVNHETGTAVCPSCATVEHR